MSLLGIDVGSSRCKAAVFSCTGALLAEAARGYVPQFGADGKVEIDPVQYWLAVQAVVREVAAQVGDDAITALALSTHGETLVPVDRDGQALGMMIANADNRAVAEAQWWDAQVGKARIFDITGTVVHPMFPLVKLAWLQRHEPERFAAAARFVSIQEYLLMQLGLPPLIDFSLASRFMAFDVRKQRWSTEMLAPLGLPVDRLPIPVPAGTIAGRLDAAIAESLGLLPGTLVAIGGHDQPCGALGVGAIHPGDVSDSIGTYECLVAIGAHPTLSDGALAANLNTYCHVVPDHFITIAFFPSGVMLQWYQELLASPHGEVSFAELEAHAPPHPTGLCITPHLLGSCTPYWDPRATAVIAGLTPRADRYHLYKGILEGLACEFTINVEVLTELVGPFDLLRVTGGGARSPLGLHLRAALSGRKLQPMCNQEAVCLGAALLAGVASGAYTNLEEAVTATMQPGEVIPAAEAIKTAYASQFAQYRRLYTALSAFREAYSEGGQP